MTKISLPFAPNRKRLDRYLDQIFERKWLTNGGPVLEELTDKLADYLGVANLLLVSNGTLALQIAYKALNLEGEVITTPYTFSATGTSLAWEGLRPVFADIDAKTLNLDPTEAAKAVGPETGGIVPVHVYGNPCDVEALEKLAKKFRLPLIYDAAHAFGIEYNGESLLKWGDAATLSFHATKVFHTIEGGAVVFKRKDDYERAKRLINFGLVGHGEISEPGINAKLDEIRAAVGLCILEEIDLIIEKRLELTALYDKALGDYVERPALRPGSTANGIYYPVLFQGPDQREAVERALEAAGISGRRYFAPSLDEVACFGDQTPCPVSRDAASRVLCLPMYADLALEEAERVVSVVLGGLK